MKGPIMQPDNRKKNKNSALQIDMFKESEKLAGVGSWFWDVEKDTWTFSENWLSIHGCTKKTITTKELFQIAHPEDKNKIQDAFNNIIQNQVPYEIEHRIIKQDTKETRFVKAYGKIIEKKNGKASKVTGAALDITEFKKADQQIQEKEEIFNSIYNNSPTGIFRSTPSGEVLSANQAFLEIYGFNNLKELHEIPAQEYYTNSDDRKEMIELLQKHGTLKNFITKERKKDQTEIWVKTNYSAVKNKKGEIIYIDGLVEDITNTKKTENDLLKQNTLLKSLTKILQNKFGDQVEMLDYSLEQAIKLTHSKIGYIYYYNEQKKQFTLNTWSGEVMKECSVLDPQTVYNLDSTGCWGEAVRQRKPYINNHYSTDVKYEKGTPQGHVQLKKFLTVPIFDQNKIKAVIGVANKETDYVDEDIDQLTLLMNAVWKIVEQNRYQNELKNAKEKAEQSDRLKTLFLNNLSHEIRTPLNGILGFAKLLNKENLNSERRKEYIDIVYESGNRLTRVVEDIIDISMLDSDQMEINLSSFNLNEFLTEIYNEHHESNLLQSKPQVDFRLNITTHKSQTLEADNLRLQQVLDNLITNAIKWSDNGTIEIGCVYEKSDSIKIYVKDEGKGIPKDQKHKLFKRFSKIETKEINEGIGVGLAISKGVMDLHGGKIWHEDNKPAGSVFNLTLPVKKIEKEIPNEKPKSKQDKATGNLIYIAEDDQVSREFLKELLKETEYNIEFAENGEDLLKLMENEIPSLILLDIKMPKLNGFDTLTQLKEKYPKIKVIAQTAHAMGSEKDRILKAGFDDYISKPIDQDKLVNTIKKYLR